MKKYIFSKYIFARPKKSKILFYDGTNSFLIKKKLQNYNCSTLHVRGESINVVVLFTMLLNFEFSLKKYIYYYIKFVQPKVVLTFIDNDFNFYTLKKNFPKIIFISVQGGYRSKYRDFFASLKQFKKENKTLKLKADFIFLYGKAMFYEYSKFIKFKPVFFGSYRNNFVPIIKNKQKKRTLLFISQFRTKNILMGNSYNVEVKLLPLIADFCLKNNFKFSILGCSLQHKEDEKIFFSNVLSDKNWNFIERKSLLSNFTIVDKFELITFIDSTLGYESIARKKKIAVFSTRKFNSYPAENFNWALNLKKKGFFYSNEITKKEVFRVLKNVSTINQKKMHKIYSNIFKKTINFNSNNIKLLKIIKKHT